MSKWLSLFFVLFLVTPVFADTLPDENSLKDLADRVMTKAVGGDMAASFEIMKPYMPVAAKDVDAAGLDAKLKREVYNRDFGTPIGFEFVDSKKIGNSLIRLRYIEKDTKSALSWVFYFYKVKDGWMINICDWGGGYEKLFN